MNVAFLTIKTVPCELARESIKAARFYILVCTNMYGSDWMNRNDSEMIVDGLFFIRELEHAKGLAQEKETPVSMHVETDKKKLFTNVGPRWCFASLFLNIPRPNNL
jgi:hypothetical protein